jgi:hypothetical protein
MQKRQCQHLGHSQCVVDVAGDGRSLRDVPCHKSPGSYVCTGIYAGRNGFILARCESPQVELQRKIQLARGAESARYFFFFAANPPWTWLAVIRYLVHHNVTRIFGQTLSAEHIFHTRVLLLSSWSDGVVFDVPTNSGLIIARVVRMILLVSRNDPALPPDDSPTAADVSTQHKK